MKPGPPGRWTDDDKWSPEWKDVTCPECLAGKDYLETFAVSGDGKAITCKRCKCTSTRPGDVEHHWCPVCQADHDNLWPPARRWWIEHPDPPELVELRLSALKGVVKNETHTKSVR